MIVTDSLTCQTNPNWSHLIWCTLVVRKLNAVEIFQEFEYIGVIKLPRRLMLFCLEKSDCNRSKSHSCIVRCGLESREADRRFANVASCNCRERKMVTDNCSGVFRGRGATQDGPLANGNFSADV